MDFRRGIPMYRIAAPVLLLLAVLAACTATKPVSYPMRTTLPFGSIEMTVDSTESTLDMERQALLVHIRMSNLEGERQARVAGQSWNQLFQVSDGKGKKYNCRRFLPADAYYQNFSGGTRGGEKAWGGSRAPEDTYLTVPTQWIARFDVPADASGFTLLIDSARFHTGTQPAYMAVALDR